MGSARAAVAAVAAEGGGVVQSGKVYWCLLAAALFSGKAEQAGGINAGATGARLSGILDTFAPIFSLLITVIILLILVWNIINKEIKKEKIWMYMSDPSFDLGLGYFGLLCWEDI